MKFVKEHLFAIFALIVLLIILVGGFVAVYLLFYSESVDPYNTRLNGIEKYPISSTKVKEAKEKLIESGKVDTVNYVLEGRLISFDINVKKDTELNAIKEIASKVLESFTEEQLSFYDVHIVIKNDEEAKEIAEKNKELKGSEEGVLFKTIYPVFGAKHKTSKEIRWTK